MVLKQKPIKMEKRARVVRLLHITNNAEVWGNILTSTFGKPQHLYITTDDEIKEDDWYVLTKNDGTPTTILKATVDGGSLKFNSEKIIATTDTKLKLPQPSKDFIESYCKNPVDKVMVEYGRTMDGTPTYNRLALTSNNEIIIHLIEEKMYSKDEVVQLLMKSLDATVTKHDKFRALFETQLQEWINKKLN